MRGALLRWNLVPISKFLTYKQEHHELSNTIYREYPLKIDKEKRISFLVIQMNNTDKLTCQILPKRIVD